MRMLRTPCKEDGLLGKSILILHEILRGSLGCPFLHTHHFYVRGVAFTPQHEQNITDVRSDAYTNRARDGEQDAS